MTTLTAKKRILESVAYGTKCDQCGTVCNTTDPSGWHGFSKQHSDWGSDSGDSYEYYDVCSVDCYLTKLAGVLNDEDSDTLEVDGKNREFVKELLKK